MNLEWSWTIHISLHFQVQTLLRLSIPLTKGPQLSSHQVWEDWWNLVPWWWLNLNKDRITVTVHDGWIMVGSLEQIGWGAVQYISTCVNQQPKPPTLVDQPWSMINPPASTRPCKGFQCVNAYRSCWNVNAAVLPNGELEYQGQEHPRTICKISINMPTCRLHSCVSRVSRYK